MNNSSQPSGPPGKARSMIGLTSFTFSVSSHRLSALAHANISSSAFARKSGRSATSAGSTDGLVAAGKDKVLDRALG